MERPPADTGELDCLNNNRMYTNALDRIEYGDKAAKRAQSEELEFDVPTAGVVVVTNVSHDSAHSVNVEDGVPVGCSCKAATYQDGACKHRVACAMAAPVLEAASTSRSAGKRALADGGQLVEPVQEESEETGRPDDCDCTPAFCDDELGCWPCYRDGFESANPAVEDADQEERR